MNEELENLAAHLKEKVRIAKDNYESQKKYLNQILNEIAISECPYSVGDILENPGNAHKGKKVRVTRISRTDYDFLGKWKCIVVVLKKDGNDSSSFTDFSEIHINLRAKEYKA